MEHLHSGKWIVKKSDMAFIGSMVLFVIFKLLSSSYYAYIIPGFLFRIVNVIVILILILKNLNKAFVWRRKAYILVPIIILCGIVGYVSENVLTLMVFALLIISSYDIDFDKIIKWMIISYILIIVAVCIPSILGVIPNQISIHDGENAHYIGFLYYTTFPNIITMLSIFILYKSRENKFVLVVFLSVINWFIYKYCTSLHAIVAFSYFIVLYVIDLTTHIFERKNQILDLLSIIFYPLCMGLSLYACVFYYQNPASRELLNKFFNNRIMLMSNSFYENGIHLFGNAVKMTTKLSEYNYVDSGYMYMLLVYGILFSVLIIGAYTLLLLKIRRNGNCFIFVWMLTIGVYALSNRVFLSLQYNPILYLMPQMIYKSYSKRKTNGKKNVCQTR